MVFYHCVEFFNREGAKDTKEIKEKGKKKDCWFVGARRRPEFTEGSSRPFAIEEKI